MFDGPAAVPVGRLIDRRSWPRDPAHSETAVSRVSTVDGLRLGKRPCVHVPRETRYQGLPRRAAPDPGAVLASRRDSSHGPTECRRLATAPSDQPGPGPSRGSSFSILSITGKDQPLTRASADHPPPASGRRNPAAFESRRGAQ
jgi:hypothetical protein